MSETPFGRQPVLFARLKGKGGKVREYLALVSTACEYSILPKVDAYHLGHPEAARDDIITQPPNLLTGVTYNGYWEGMLVVLEEVEVTGHSVKNVQFVAFDVPQVSAFDVVLGNNLLQALKAQVDYGRSALRVGGDGVSP